VRRAIELEKHISEISLRRGVVENNYGVVPFGNLTYSYGVNGPFADEFPSYKPPFLMDFP
jgi:hypothetical protein